MDRDTAVKELQQKTENYEHRIREQQEQLSLQQTTITVTSCEFVEIAVVAVFLCLMMVKPGKII